MNRYNQWITTFLCVALIAVCGCQKQEEKSKDTRKETREKAPRIDESAITPQVAEAFPMLHNYFYPFGNVLSTSTVPNDEEDFAIRSKLPDILKVEYYIETTDSVENLYTFYSKLFEREVLRKFYSKNILQTLIATAIFEEDGYKDLPYEVYLKVSHPGSTFSEDVRKSQMDAITQQITQFEKILDKQKKRLTSVTDSNIASTIENGITQSQKRIEELQMQSRLLEHKTTLVQISIKYLYIKPVQKTVDKIIQVEP